eukprot:m.763899 g.763899  ORF g.763899 m.763899 type:complete len:439 (+) comp23212_c0_seq2:230-1546(+)
MGAEQVILCVSAVVMCNSFGISLMNLAGTCLTGLLTLVIIFSFGGEKPAVQSPKNRTDKSSSIPRLPPLSLSTTSSENQSVTHRTQSSLPFSNPDKTLMDLLMGNETTAKDLKDSATAQSNESSISSNQCRELAAVILKQLLDAGLQRAGLHHVPHSNTDVDVSSAADFRDDLDHEEPLKKFLYSTAKDAIDWHAQEDSGLLFHVSLDNVMTTLDRRTIDAALAVANANDFSEEHLFRCSTACSPGGSTDANGRSSDFKEGSLSPLRASVIPPDTLATPLLSASLLGQRSDAMIISTLSPEPPSALAQEERDAMNAFEGSSSYKASAIISADLAHAAHEHAVRRALQTLAENQKTVDEYAAFVAEGKVRASVADVARPVCRGRGSNCVGSNMAVTRERDCVARCQPMCSCVWCLRGWWGAVACARRCPGCDPPGCSVL